MKNLILNYLIIVTITLFNISCEKAISKNGCYAAKILKTSCGGSVLQLLSKENIGEEWRDASSNTDSTNYRNCVLVGMIPGESKTVGDTLHIDFQKVDFFQNGDFCDIGGLPSTKIEIKNLYTDDCLTN